MKILGIEISQFKRKAQAPEPEPGRALPVPNARERRAYNEVWTMPFDGEKNLGEMGPIRRYMVDHASLRLRSWQLYLESEMCQIVFGRFTTWVIGEGLKLQAEPQTHVLASEQLGENLGTFDAVTEARFKVYTASKIGDHAGMKTIHERAEEAFLNSIVGGDVLVVLRIVNMQVKVQLIDGEHLGTPSDIMYYGSERKAANGNRVRDGIEINAMGQHVAYHVRTATNTFERIEARGAKSGNVMAFMVYGLGYRLDTCRGIPLITAIMETAKKMERYKEATVGSAEERQKIPYYIKHGPTSNGDNMFGADMMNATGASGAGDLPVDVDGNVLASKVAATTNKQVFNMPIDSELISLESKNELGFREFYTVNIDVVCATAQIPPNIAMSKYDSNFSASRAAIKDWEHTLNVRRAKFARQFYQPIYDLWLEIEILKNKIQAPGYLTALAQGNEMALAAYRYARFVGATVPHIDPVKEVMAERAKLGPLGANFPLTTMEAATEALNGGDSIANMKQFGEEMEKAEGFGIPKAGPPPPDGEVEDKEKEGA